MQEIHEVDLFEQSICNCYINYLKNGFTLLSLLFIKTISHVKAPFAPDP